MALKSGYLVPEIQPEGMICVKLYIPSDDLYLYALSGAYQYFTKWVAWERGNSHKALLAAEKWQEAYDYTMANAWLNCGEDEVTTINFNPVITVTTGGGENCCSASPPPWDDTPMPGGTPCYPMPVVNPPVPNTPPTIPPDTDPSEWEILRCQAANYAFDQIRVWLVAISQIPGDLLSIGAIITLIWTWAPLGLLALIGTAVLELASVIWSWYALSEGIDEVAEYGIEWWDDHQEEIVCQLFEMSDNVVTRNAIVSVFLEDLATWAAGRPWWVSSLAGMLQSVGNRLLPLQIFLAPWELVPPVGYVGAISCPCSPPEDEEWQEHPTYVWVPLTNAMLDSIAITVDSPAQNNVKAISLADTGIITWHYTNAVSGDWIFELASAAVLAAVPGGTRIAGVGWDFYDSQPLFSAGGGSPYWYQFMNGAANFDATVTDSYPKKWWVWCSNPLDSDVNATLDAIADYHDPSALGAMDTEVIGTAEIQSSSSHARSGRCRVRFLVKVED